MGPSSRSFHLSNQSLIRRVSFPRFTKKIHLLEQTRPRSRAIAVASPDLENGILAVIYDSQHPTRFSSGVVKIDWAQSLSQGHVANLLGS